MFPEIRVWIDYIDLYVYYIDLSKAKSEASS